MNKNYIIGQTFTSNRGDKFDVVGVGNSHDIKHKLYTIRFHKTGFETDTKYTNIVSGEVQDWSLVPKIEDYMDGTLENSVGDKYIVLSNVSKKLSAASRNPYYPIRFLATGTEDYFRFDCIAKGAIKDKTKPIIASIGFIVGATKKNNRRAYDLWRNMLKRCYDVTRHDYYRYGGKGVTVDTRWNSFRLFLQDIVLLDGYTEILFNESKIQLDKDKKQFHLPHSERVYSKDTCVWLSPTENSKFSTRHPKKGPPYRNV